MNMQEWVAKAGDDIKITFPHHLLIVWYPQGQWAINVDNLRVDHMVCLMEWLNDQLVKQEIPFNTRYRLYRSWGRSRWASFWHAVRP